MIQKHINALAFKLILLGSIFNSCQSVNNFNKKNNSLVGNWKGNYNWKCESNNYGNEKIIFNVESDEKGVIKGTVSYSKIKHYIKGFRIVDAKLDEWSFTGGKLSEKGEQIIIDILKKEDSKTSLNTFSGTLKNNNIIGITRNGEKCSSYKGPSGKFSIKR
ncbi:MAG: hypothetical protein P8I51_00545 [Polaribacter sp.]|nr:hypothetical protein [Polaribacter sp.]MDG1953361.1 hypothetical protein [Polaribacter sp.]MDG1993165.1 hypothetical protein [Polaribacter sp.]